MEYLKGASLGYALALPANIRIGWKGLPGTNTLANYKHSKITIVKSFITLGSFVKVAVEGRFTCGFATNFANVN